MTSGHDEMLDSVAALALGVLPAAEANAVAEHVRGCADCRAEYDGLRAVADTIGVSAELRAGELDELAEARMKANVMKTVRASNGTATRVAPTQTAEPAQPVPVVRSRGVGSWIPWMVAAAAVVVALLSAAAIPSMRAQNDRSEQLVATLQTQLAAANQTADRERTLERRLAEVTAPGSKHFPVASGEVVTSGGHVYLALRVAALAPGKVYQAWTLRAGAKTVAPSVTFVPERGGIAFVALPESSNGLAAVAVSVEPSGGSKAPTSSPTFVRALS